MNWTDQLRRSITSLLVAILLTMLGGAFLIPMADHKALVGPDGHVVLRPDGRPVMQSRDPYAKLRANWAAYACWGAATVSLLLALVQGGCGLIAILTHKTQPRDPPNGGPAEPFGDSNVRRGPPSVT